MSDELVTVLYAGPQPIFPVRHNQTKQTFNFLKGKTLDVPADFAKLLTASGEGSEFNSRGFTKDQLELARAYDHHIFSVVGKKGPAVAEKFGPAEVDDVDEQS